MEKIYLYLVKRNKTDAKIIGTLVSPNHIQTSRLTNLDDLGLTAQERIDLTKAVQDHRMEWEPWIETAGNYHILRESMLKRGIHAPPSANSPLINFTSEVPKVVAVKLNKNKTMIRRMS